ncbi:hypothetical protein [Helicobacter typhlonius]|uniref:hypothetical protein n=1 Tax=Helicobacter typhlonius TaxID=76936 RepID=UPI0038B31612
MTCNIGLVVSRRTIIHGGWRSVFITNKIAELGLLGDNRGGGSVFPLYLYQKA